MTIRVVWLVYDEDVEREMVRSLHLLPCHHIDHEAGARYYRTKDTRYGVLSARKRSRLARILQQKDRNDNTILYGTFQTANLP